MLRKTFILLLALLIPLAVSARYDRAPVPMKAGTVYTYENVTRDGDISRSSFEVLSAADSAGTVRVAILHSGEVPEGITAEQARELYTEYYTVTDATWSADVIGKIKKTTLDVISAIVSQAGKDEMPEITIDTGDSENPVYPNVLTPGQTVNIRPVTITVSVAGVSVNCKTEFKSHECTGTERLVTPAGIFDTYIVEEEAHISFKIFGIGKKQRVRTKTWYAPGVGTIKTITWDGKKQTGTQTLISLTQKL